MIDLKKISARIDAALAKETKESFEQWMASVMAREKHDDSATQYFFDCYWVGNSSISVKPNPESDALKVRGMKTSVKNLSGIHLLHDRQSPPIDNLLINKKPKKYDPEQSGSFFFTKLATWLKLKTHLFLLKVTRL